MIGEPTIIVTCDRCGTDEQFELTPLAGRGWDDRNLAGAMKRSKWVKDNHGFTYCEDCQIDQEQTARVVQSFRL